ncbi:MAG TPA: L-threonine 3-dehydrogenase [Acidobacteriota bacterium]|nr:L-threonine 3-dehydrogenase [Acidobacteriota bacterium]
MKMKAVVKTRPEIGAELIDVDMPRVDPDQVLVRVLATSICGTDVHIYEWEPWAQSRIGAERLPQILGHELAGEVVEVGAAVHTVKPGDYISAETHIPCGHCPQCLTGQMHICHNLKIFGVDRDGCFAEYAVVPETVVWKNDRSIPPEFTAVQEPLGNAVYCALVEPVAGRTVMVVGDGPTALFAVGVARTAGAARVVLAGMEPARLDIARRMGADQVINVLEDDPVRTILDTTGGIGMDVVLEMAGNQKAIDAAFRCVRKGGRVSAFGIPSGSVALDWNNAVVLRGVTVYGINGRLMFDTWITVRNLLASGRLDISPVVTHKLPLSDYAKGFDLMIKSPKTCGKVVLFPQGVT